MAYLIREERSVCYKTNLPRSYPVELGDTLDGTAPAGLPIMSTCFIVDKLCAAFCDGKDNWFCYGSDGTVKSITAGQTWAELFA